MVNLFQEFAISHDEDITNRSLGFRNFSHNFSVREYNAEISVLQNVIVIGELSNLPIQSCQLEAQALFALVPVPLREYFREEHHCMLPPQGKREEKKTT